jgi:fumarate hydratase class I
VAGGTVPDFAFQEMFPVHPHAPWRKLTSEHVRVGSLGGKPILEVEPEALTLLAREAFRAIEHLFRPGHLQQLRAIWDDPEASDNDRFVAYSSSRTPTCRRDGAPVLPGHRHRDRDGQEGPGRLHRPATTRRPLARHLRPTPRPTSATASSRRSTCTRRSTPRRTCPRSSTSTPPGDEYNFLFITKGGGSANKTFLFQETKALLNPKSSWPSSSKIKLGTAACPPYHLAVVIGGT